MVQILKTVLFAVGLICGLSISAAAQSTFSSGTTAAQGVFPPAAFSNITYSALELDLKTGIVAARNGSTVTTVASSGGAVSGDVFPSGELNFTTFTVPSGVTLTFGKNSLNTPVTVLASEVSIAGTIDIKGAPGATGNTFGISPGGKAGPGGFDGGQGGAPAVAGRAATAGGPGIGRNGGAAGVPSVDPSTTLNDDGKPAAFPHSNPGLLPLTGGSGGGGGAGWSDGTRSASGGGGGGGAILIAASGRILIRGSIHADGGNGDNPEGNAGGGGGGAGGGIRLMANRLELINAGLHAPGGSSCCSQGRAGVGMIRLEAFDFVTSSGVGGAMEINPPSTTGQPSAIRPANLPRLRISSIGGVAVPDAATGATLADIALPTGSSAPANPMAVVVTGTNIPNGTAITLSLKTTQGAESSASTTLNNNTGSANLTVPTGVSYIQAYTASFTIAADLQQQLPLFQGEKILQAQVIFDGMNDQTLFFTESGLRVSAKELLALQ